MKDVISASELNENLSNDNLIVLDASPDATASGKVALYQSLRIPNARRFNIKAHFSDKSSLFPNTIPSAEQFEIGCKMLGINKDSHIVVYDNLGIYTSPRVWWLFKMMGHDKVSILDGGLNDWIKQGFETVEKSTILATFEPGDFKSAVDLNLVVNYEDVCVNGVTNDFLLVDARAAGRYDGVEPEPRKHLQSGSIPNSINIPFKSLLDNGKFKSKNKLRQIFEEKINTSKPLVFTCGSGMTACIVMLAYIQVGGESRFLYDGSWSEYAELQNLKTDV